MRKLGSANAPLHLPLEVIERLPSPCLIVDRDAVDRNIRRLATHAASTGTRLRPHFKAHKCTTLMRRQLDAGNCVGVTCQTTDEALVLVAAGFEDVLISNEVVDRLGLECVGQAARRANLTVCIDSYVGLRLLRSVSERHQVNIGVLIEIDVGAGRAGMNVDDDGLVALALSVADAAKLQLRGLQGYEGHAMMIRDRDKRSAAVHEAGRILARARDRLMHAGIDCEVISGGGTGTFDLTTDLGVWNELQAGSYVLMDMSYARIDSPFEVALFCLASVASLRGPTVVLDAGLKMLATDKGLPTSFDSRLNIQRMADEHAIGEAESGLELAVGDRLWLVPSHVDPTVNLADVMFAWSAEQQILEAWPIDGRRRADGSDWRVTP